MIRLATLDDVETLVDIGILMVEEGRYSYLGHNRKKMTLFAEYYIRAPDNLLLVSEMKGRICGFYCGYITDFSFQNALRAGEELWYMLPECRGSRDGIGLIIGFIKWGKKQGAVEIDAGVSLGVNDKGVGKILLSLGFHQAGANYKMVLS